MRWSRRCCADGVLSRRPGGCGKTRSRRGSGWSAGSASSPTSTRGRGRRGTWMSRRCTWSPSGIWRPRRPGRIRAASASSASSWSTPATDGQWRVSGSSVRGAIRWRSAMSGTRSPISTTTKAIPRPGRSPARSCSGSWTTPMSRWTAQSGPGARERWQPTGTRRWSRSCTGGDWGRNPAAPEFGRYGMLNVRYGKAKRGQPPRRRNVASVMAWAVEAVGDYVENVRPRFGCADHPALWVTERGGRVKPAEINARFVAYRDALGLPQALVPHSIRHSYVSHLTEDGVDRRFIQVNVGHEADSSTAIYTHVSADFMNTTLRKALAPALEAGPGKEG